MRDPPHPAVRRVGRVCSQYPRVKSESPEDETYTAADGASRRQSTLDLDDVALRSDPPGPVTAADRELHYLRTAYALEVDGIRRAYMREVKERKDDWRIEKGRTSEARRRFHVEKNRRMEVEADLEAVKAELSRLRAELRLVSGCCIANRRRRGPRGVGRVGNGNS